MSMAAQAVAKDQFEEVVGVLAERAFEDQCTTANPKLPLISELKEIYMKAYKGE
jgi:acetaldehyde dehydrogenase/alcohol dehydrogenase